MTAFFIVLIVLFLFFCVIQLWRHGRGPRGPLELERTPENPILSPAPEHWWESEAVFNPAAVVAGGRVHLFYRALGPDGVSRIGYASSEDGIHFNRLPYPVFSIDRVAQAHAPATSPARLAYDTISYASGGGWGGAEDPRAVLLDGNLYLTFNVFNGWDSLRVAYTSLNERDLERSHWAWDPLTYLSRPGERQKNWVLFPQKIGGKYALLHTIYGPDDRSVRIKYLDALSSDQAPSRDESVDPQQQPFKRIAWHEHMRSAGAPPLKTPEGWLVFYHASGPREPAIGYKLGAMLLDLADPTKVIARAQRPVLEPRAWYENDWKPGVIVATGAVILGKDLIVYYGGGDKYVAAARANLRDFLRKLKSGEPAMLEPVKA